MHWYTGPPSRWLAERMNWPEGRMWTEPERLRHKGLVEVNGRLEVRAKREAVELALFAWREQRAIASRKRRRPTKAEHAGVCQGFGPPRGRRAEAPQVRLDGRRPTLALALFLVSLLVPTLQIVRHRVPSFSPVLLPAPSG